MLDIQPGAVRPITTIGATVLAQPCADVTEFDDDLRTLVADMIATMHAAPGVGLAANQVGIGLRVFVIDCPDDAQERLVGHVVNPVLEILDTAPHPGDEGCLSVPGPRAEVGRAIGAVVTGLDCTGSPVRLEGRGLAARCLQHETDHLAGRLYVDRLDEAERNRVLDEYESVRLARS